MLTSDMPGTPIDIFLVGNSVWFRLSLKFFVSNLPGVNIRGHYTDTRDYLSSVKPHRDGKPRLLLIDASGAMIQSNDNAHAILPEKDPLVADKYFFFLNDQDCVIAARTPAGFRFYQSDYDDNCTLLKTIWPWEETQLSYLHLLAGFENAMLKLSMQERWNRLTQHEHAFARLLCTAEPHTTICKKLQLTPQLYNTMKAKICYEFNTQTREQLASVLLSKRFVDKLPSVVFARRDPEFTAPCLSVKERMAFFDKFHQEIQPSIADVPENVEERAFIEDEEAILEARSPLDSLTPIDKHLAANELLLSLTVLTPAERVSFEDSQKGWAMQRRFVMQKLFAQADPQTAAAIRQITQD